MSTVGKNHKETQKHISEEFSLVKERWAQKKIKNPTVETYDKKSYDKKSRPWIS